MGIIYRNVKGSELEWDELDGNFAYLDAKIGGSGVTLQNELTLVDKVLTVSPLWEWVIFGTNYKNLSENIFTINYAASGKQRIDALVANQANAFEILTGVESVSSPFSPAVPANKVLISYINVSDNAIGTPSFELAGIVFVEKAAYSITETTVAGASAIIPFKPYGAGTYVLTNGGLDSISGFDFSLITGVANALPPFMGQTITIENATGHDVLIKHDDPSAAVAILPILGEDLILPNGIMLVLKYKPEGLRQVVALGGDVKRVAVCDLGKFQVKVTAVNNFVQNANFSLYYAPTAATGVSNHLLLSPDVRSIVYKVPFDCSLEQLSMINSTNFDSIISIWKTAPNSPISTPIEIFYDVYSGGLQGQYINYTIDSPKILKDSFIHIFYARTAATSTWSCGGFLRFKEI